MKILTLSDTVVGIVYSSQIRERFGDVEMVIGCGDLPYYYLEYVVSMLDNRPVFFVRGNHSMVMEYGEAGPRAEPCGAVDLHCRMINYRGVLLAGVEGSVRYRPGPFQYTQQEMWRHVFRLVPRLLINRLRHGRYLDIFVTHASPEGIHDDTDLPHQGIRAFRWLIHVFQPSYHFHGHIHTYRPDAVIETRLGRTRVINTYGYRKIEAELPVNKE